MKKLITICLIALCSTLTYGQQVHNAKTPLDPAQAKLPPQKRPLIIDTVLTDSKIYPSTKRTIQIMIPRQYTGNTPACLTVGLDGNLFNATTVIPNLIESGEMPVTIAILLNPGVTYGADGQVIRYNRSNEFDRTDNRLATFIETEVIPFVESIVTPDNRKILISKDPNDRAITGASSSGIAAFTVAWERPDLFSRVYSSVGTFVAMRGGNEYPVLVRKSEPKALRIYLQDGVNDTWNHIFGDWWEQNQLMASALNYAGYEFDYKWDRGNHSIKYGNRAYPDAMRWLWRGWPAKVEKGKTMNQTISNLLIENQDWEIASESEKEEFDKVMAKEQIKSVPGSHRVITLYNNNKYISNNKGEIFLLKNGEKKAQKLQSTPMSGKEIAIYPNGKMLIATEKNSNWLISYLIAPDGTLHSPQQFYWLHNTDNHNHTPYGNIVFDTQGNLYIATAIGIQICDQNGRVRGIFSTPGGGREVEAIAFIGNKLYAQSGGILYKRNVTCTGFNNLDKFLEIKSQGQG